jgi:alkyl sulfatase BDS1-like metallo-beta-lactamase superfamily hydrolase
VIDPLLCKVTAAAAFELCTKHRGGRPVDRDDLYANAHRSSGGVRAVCAAENVTRTLHNILTIHGALVRDAHAWAHYLTETIDLRGDELDVVFASHHWPAWDRARAVEYLALQRDLHLYLHDQTLRLINQGSDFAILTP